MALPVRGWRAKLRVRQDGREGQVPAAKIRTSAETAAAENKAPHQERPERQHHLPMGLFIPHCCYGACPDICSSVPPATRRRSLAMLGGTAPILAMLAC